MEDYSTLFESLLERTTSVVNTNLELIKLKVLDKTSDGISSLISHTVVLVFVTTALFFINVGTAILIGEQLQSYYLGFLIVAAFYGLIGIIIRLFFYKRMKNLVSNYIIRNVLK